MQVHYTRDGSLPSDFPKADVGIVVINEGLYVEGYGDRSDLQLPAEDIALLERVRTYCEKMVVIMIKRHVKNGMLKEVYSLLREQRAKAMKERGHVRGETLSR